MRLLIATANAGLLLSIPPSAQAWEAECNPSELLIRAKKYLEAPPQVSWALDRLEQILDCPDAEIGFEVYLYLSLTHLADANVPLAREFATRARAEAIGPRDKERITALEEVLRVQIAEVTIQTKGSDQNLPDVQLNDPAQLPPTAAFNTILPPRHQVFGEQIFRLMLIAARRDLAAATRGPLTLWVPVANYSLSNDERCDVQAPSTTCQVNSLVLVERYYLTVGPSYLFTAPLASEGLAIGHNGNVGITLTYHHRPNQGPSLFAVGSIYPVTVKARGRATESTEAVDCDLIYATDPNASGTWEGDSVRGTLKNETVDMVNNGCVRRTVAGAAGVGVTWPQSLMGGSLHFLPGVRLDLQYLSGVGMDPGATSMETSIPGYVMGTDWLVTSVVLDVQVSARLFQQETTQLDAVLSLSGGAGLGLLINRNESTGDRLPLMDSAILSGGLSLGLSYHFEELVEMH